MAEKPISRRRLGDAFDEFAAKTGQRPTVVSPGALDPDLQAIVTAALDLGYYRTLDSAIAKELADSVGFELADRVSKLPETP